jgi:hypothetical protein
MSKRLKVAPAPRADGPAFEVPNKDVAVRAQALATSWQRRSNAVWRELERLRERGKVSWDWPAWCWLSSDVVGAWADLYVAGPTHRTTAGCGVASLLGEVEKSGEGWLLNARSGPDLAHTIISTQLTAAATWRVTRGIYRFDPALLATLLGAPVDRIPPGIFLQLPEWCPYVDLDGGVPDGVNGDRLVGFYAHLDWMPLFPAKAMLRLVVAVERENPRRLVWTPECLPLEYETLGEAWADLSKLASEDRRQKAGAEWSSMMRVCLPPLLYLCSTRPDVRHRTDPLRHPERRPPQARDDGGPDWWEVGYRIGSALRRYTLSENTEEAAAGSSGRGTHRSPKPHIRHTHWQRYRIGPGRQDVRVQLKLPFLVGDLEGREPVPVIRRVKSDGRDGT